MKKNIRYKNHLKNYLLNILFVFSSSIVIYSCASSAESVNFPKVTLNVSAVYLLPETTIKLKGNMVTELSMRNLNDFKGSIQTFRTGTKDEIYQRTAEFTSQVVGMYEIELIDYKGTMVDTTYTPPMFGEYNIELPINLEQYPPNRVDGYKRDLLPGGDTNFDQPY